MTARKQRLTVTVDPDLIEAGSRAVASGSAESLSGWVNAALAERVQRDRRLEELRAAIADYEAEFGEIAAAEMATQRRADREGPEATSSTLAAERSDARGSQGDHRPDASSYFMSTHGGNWT